MDLENLVSRAKWGDEDDGEDVKDNWEDEDEEPPKPVPVEPKKPVTSKKNEKKKIDPNGAGNNVKVLTAAELREKRLQEEKAQKETDMRLTKEMLGVDDKDIALEFPLETNEDFDKFHKNLVHKLWCYDKNPNYNLLVEKLFRDLCAPLEVDELKSISATVNALFNEKVKVNKATKPKKKGAKLNIKMERTDLDRDDLDYRNIDELDDIM